MPLHRIPSDKIGILYRKYGAHHPDDKYRVRTHGSPGIQAVVLSPDRLHFRSQFQYRIEYAPVTYVPPGTIAVVVALTGAPAPVNQMFARSVECDFFQDGEKFLLQGGQMGRQLEVLGAGKYNINPHIFEVLTVDTIGEGKYGLTANDLREISVPEGNTGVVVALEGGPSDDDDHALGGKVDGHQSFQIARAFLDNGGQRGAQKETLGPGGVYRINPWFARVIIIPTRDLILEWTTRSKKPASNFDAALDQITVNVNGFRLQCTMSQTIRIPPRSAPALVQRFGEVGTNTIYGSNATASIAPVQRFVEKVLGATVEGYFHTTASQHTVEEFFEKSELVRKELEDSVRNALADWDVKAVRTALGEFIAPDGRINEIRQAPAEERIRGELLGYQNTNADTEVKIAGKHIEIKRQERELEKAAEIAMIRELLDVLGRDYLAQERFIERLAEMDVPSTVVTDANMLNNYMSLGVVQHLFDSVRKPPEMAPRPELPDDPNHPIGS